MEITISSVIASAVGYIFSAIATSETAKTAKEQTLQSFWNWLKPKFIKEVKEDTPPREVQAQLQELLAKDEDFMQTLLDQLKSLKTAQVKEKNIVKGSLEYIDKVHIGDKIYNANESYYRKNIVDGDVKNVGEFRLGDG